MHCAATLALRKFDLLWKRLLEFRLAEFAAGFEKALSLPDPYVVRQRARKSAKRFTEEEFAKRWTKQMEKLVAARAKKEKA